MLGENLKSPSQRNQMERRPKIRVNKISLQWHITEKCNFLCKHCYQEKSDYQEFKLNESKEVLEKFVVFLKKNKIVKKNATLQITGGEPFLKDDCFEFFEELHAKKDFFSWILMTNGSLLDREKVNSLKKLGCRLVQVSLEGLKEANDKMRGEGTFELVIEKIKLLLSEDMPTAVSLTLTRDNYQDVFKLAHFLLEIIEGLDAETRLVLGVRRIVPMGKAKETEGQMLEPKELYNFYNNVYEFNKKIKKRGIGLEIAIGCESAIFNEDIEDGQWLSKSSCRVLDKSIVVLMPDGEVYPCRRLPVGLGNIKKMNFDEILNSDGYKKLSILDDYRVPRECFLCKNVENCLGGALCINYAFSEGKKLAPDSQCWKLFESLNDSKHYMVSPKTPKKTFLKTLQILKKNLK